jgi:Nitrate and nitrite sensing/ANTAR domain
MNTGLGFLMAAKRCEIAELAQLAHTSELVHTTGQLVHALQRERGLSNLTLATAARAAPPPGLQDSLRQQIAESLGLEQALRRCFDHLHTQRMHQGQSARLFSRIAYVLHGLDALPALRQHVAHQSWTGQQATAAYVKLVAGLLSVVFEAADSASDPAISRTLVALFNLMQGKEFAGQERATGSALLAAGSASGAGQQHLKHLIESQDRCLQVFHDFAPASVRNQARQQENAHNLAELERLRRIVCTAQEGTPLDSGLSPAWFECCTLRMDDLRAVEEHLAHTLVTQCAAQMAAAQRELSTWEALPPGPDSAPDPAAYPQGDFFASPHTPFGPRSHTVAQGGLSTTDERAHSSLARSVLDLVHEQSQRLHAMAAELDTVRASLSERKVIERAKGLLMAHRQLGEDDAHKLLRQTAMAQNRRLVDVAEAVLSMAHVLPQTPLR